MGFRTCDDGRQEFACSVEAVCIGNEVIRFFRARGQLWLVLSSGRRMC